jgi:hypothetical protein
LKTSLVVILVFLVGIVATAQNSTAPSTTSAQDTSGQSGSSPQSSPSTQAPPPEQTPTAQQTPTPSTEPTESQTTKKTKSEQERELEKKEQSQRVLGVVPQFGVTSRQDAPPLMPHEKFHLFVRSAFDPVVFVLIGAQAGISQAGDNFPEYGQGASGYAKRYGAAFADNTSSNFFSNFLYPVLFKEDPRYFRLGEGTTKRRIVYGIEQEFICHTDKGGRSFAFSNVLGALTAGSISNAYYPDSDRGFGLTMSRAGIAILYGTAGGLFNEFWPDIDQKLFHRKSKERLNPEKPEAK